MKITILRLPTIRLWNSEYSIFVSQMVEVFKKYDPEHLHLKKSFERITDFLPQVLKIKAQDLSNSISNQLVELDNERDTLTMAIIAQSRTMNKLSMPEVSGHAQVLNHLLDIHGRDLATANYNSKTKRIADLLSDYEKPEIKAAIEGLNMTFLFDHLATVNTQFAGLYMQRSKEISEVEKVDVRAIRAEMDKYLTAFFNAFEFCSSEYEKPDYQTPANELNTLITHYKTQLKARASRRSNGKDVSTESPIDPASN